MKCQLSEGLSADPGVPAASAGWASA